MAFFGGQFFGGGFYQPAAGDFYNGQFFGGQFFEGSHAQGGGGVNGNPHDRLHHKGRTSGNNLQGTWNGIPLLDIIAAQNKSIVTKIVTYDNRTPKEEAVKLSETRKSEIIAEIAARKAIKQKALAQAFRELKQGLKAEIESPRIEQIEVIAINPAVVRGRHDDRDIFEMLMMDGQHRKGLHANTLAKIARYRNTKTQ